MGLGRRQVRESPHQTSVVFMGAEVGDGEDVVLGKPQLLRDPSATLPRGGREAGGDPEWDDLDARWMKTQGVFQVTARMMAVSEDASNAKCDDSRPGFEERVLDSSATQPQKEDV